MSAQPRHPATTSTGISRGSLARDERGFSLIELIVTGVVSSLFFGMVYSFTNQVGNYSTRTSSAADARQQTRLVLDRVGAGLRSAGADPSGAAFGDDVAIFPETTGTRLRFRRDLATDVNGDGDTWDVVDLNDDGDTRDNDENENADGLLNDPWEDLTYVYDSAAGTFSVVDNVTNITYTLAEGVLPNPDGTPAFRYEVDGETLVAVMVQLTVESGVFDAVTGQPQVSTGRITARPRMALGSVLDSLEESN